MKIPNSKGPNAKEIPTNKIPMAVSAADFCDLILWDLKNYQ